MFLYAKATNLPCSTYECIHFTIRLKHPVFPNIKQYILCDRNFAALAKAPFRRVH